MVWTAVSWTVPGLATTGGRASIDIATAGAAPTTLHVALTSAVMASLKFILVSLARRLADAATTVVAGAVSPRSHGAVHDARRFWSVAGTALMHDPAEVSAGS